MRSGPSSKKKEKQCDPANPKDQGKGDQWDATALDARSRFLLSLVIGKRTPDLIQEVVDDFVGRTDGRLPQLIFTDGYRAYAPALMATYGIEVEPPKTGKVGRPRSGYLEWPCGVVYATVTKTYKQGVVSGIRRELIYGTKQDLAAALEASPVSTQINTAFVERHNGTDRAHNARKARKTYQFSKDLLMHMAVSWWVVTCYNFHDLHRGLRQQLPDGTYEHRTPAMAIGLEKKPLSLAELMCTQVIGPVTRRGPRVDDFRRAVASTP